ncbi:MAG TPA: ATP-binding protein [Kofleriaceae bacterium]|nr:ATP-binding protein [Kofleriaceae bacterium]
MEHAARELWLYRRLGAFVGAVYLVWWAGVELLLPHAYNPLLGRLAVVAAIWAIAAASYASAWVARHIAVLWTCSLWLLTAHYFYLFYENTGDLNWIVGSFVTVTAVTLGMLSRASLLAYSAFATALSIGMVIALPELRHSVFVPGIMTVLLQANIGMSSRLRVVRDLAASNAHFQLLFDSTFEGVLIHEAGAIVQVNDALVRILGGDRDALALVRADEHATSWPVELQFVRGDGTPIELELRGKSFSHGRRAQRLVTIEEVTERKQRAAELKRTNEALARSNLDLQRFAYVASHDLQTPLRGIASFVDLLRSTYGDGLDTQANDWLARIGRSVDHLQTLIRDLLEYSRVDAEPRAFEPIAMREVLDRATSLLELADATITAGELPEVTGDRSQLVQLLLNLLGNAIKYRSDAAPQVHVTAEDRGDDWLFAVRDNGIGIAPNHHQQIFEIFKRLHDQKAYPGTGIGLAICRRVVDRHGGMIWVESKPGDGSAFFFTLAKRMGAHR